MFRWIRLNWQLILVLRKVKNFAGISTEKWEPFSLLLKSSLKMTKMITKIMIMMELLIKMKKINNNHLSYSSKSNVLTKSKKLLQSSLRKQKRRKPKRSKRKSDILYNFEIILSS